MISQPLYIVDNSNTENSVHKYLSEWCPISNLNGVLSLNRWTLRLVILK